MTKRLKRELTILLSAVCLVFFLAMPAGAAFWSSTVQGVVTEDNLGNNPFGLFNWDSIWATLIWDDALVVGTSADEDILIDGLPGWDFTITLGSFTFSQADVTDPTWTTFWFDSGAIDGIEFFLDPIDIGNYLNLVVGDFDGGRSLFAEDAGSGSPIYLAAYWDFPNAVNTPVPIPGTLALFAVGLLFLAGGRRKTI